MKYINKMVLAHILRNIGLNVYKFSRKAQEAICKGERVLGL